MVGDVHPERERLPRLRRLATGAAAFWVGTVGYTLSTVIIIAVVGRGSGQGGFEGLTAVLALLSVGSVVPVAVMLRTAAVVADGEAVPRLSPWLLWAFVAAGLALAPLSGAVLHVPAADVPGRALLLVDSSETERPGGFRQRSDPPSEGPIEIEIHPLHRREQFFRPHPHAVKLDVGAVDVRLFVFEVGRGHHSSGARGTNDCTVCPTEQSRDFAGRAG